MKTVFFDIDTQYDFIMPNGRLYVPGAEKLKTNFEKLMDLAIRRKIRIVASVDAHDPDDPEFEVFPPHCIKNEPGWEKIPETLHHDRYHVENRKKALNGAPKASQIILEKTEFSMFGNPNAHDLLKHLDPERAIIYGVATDYCVKAAAIGLADLGYETYVVEDAIAAVAPDTGMVALDEMKKAGVKFIKTDEVESLLD